VGEVRAVNEPPPEAAKPGISPESVVLIHQWHPLLCKITDSDVFCLPVCLRRENWQHARVLMTWWRRADDSHYLLSKEGRGMQKMFQEGA